MKVRIRPAVTRLLGRRTASTVLSKPPPLKFLTSTPSSTSTSTTSGHGSSRKPGTRAPRAGGSEDRQDQYGSLDSQLTLPRDAGSSRTPPAPSKNPKQPVAEYTADEPVLKANPYADTYRMDERELDDHVNQELAGETSGGYSRSRDKDSLLELDRLMSDTIDSRRQAIETRHKASLSDKDRRKRRSDRDASTSAAHHGRPTIDASAGERIIELGNQRIFIGKGELVLRDGGGHFIIPYYRLRDACPCPKCIDPSTRQKTHTSPEAYNEVSMSIFADTVPPVTRLRYEKNESGEGLRVDWSSNHSAFIPKSRLLALAKPTGSSSSRLIPRRRLWDKQSLLARSENLHVEYVDLAHKHDGHDVALRKTLQQLQIFGIVVIKGVPTDVTGNADSSLREVMGMIGEIRNTFYGETWNVKNIANSKNVAYTNLNLGLHMDLLYFSSPPRFQALHCLRNRVEGGSSYFVDSFAAAQEYLRESAPAAKPYIPYIEFEYDNDSHYLHHAHPLLPSSEAILEGHKAFVNWSPPFQGLPSPASVGISPEYQSRWYQALGNFQKLLEEPHREWEFTMEEGDLVLFDNRRVLHARRAFRDWTDAEKEERGITITEGEPSRWLKGCYLDGEVVWDKLVVLNKQVNDL